MDATPSEKVCGRCNGNGVIEHYRHICQGICFRCWGLGTDPQTVTELEAWLVRARQEYRKRQGCQDAQSQKELAMIVKLGKANRRMVDRLKAGYQRGRAVARANLV